MEEQTDRRAGTHRSRSRRIFLNENVKAIYIVCLSGRDNWKKGNRKTHHSEYTPKTE